MRQIIITKCVYKNTAGISDCGHSEIETQYDRPLYKEHNYMTLLKLISYSFDLHFNIFIHSCSKLINCTYTYHVQLIGYILRTSIKEDNFSTVQKSKQPNLFILLYRIMCPLFRGSMYCNNSKQHISRLLTLTTLSDSIAKRHLIETGHYNINNKCNVVSMYADIG